MRPEEEMEEQEANMQKARAKQEQNIEYQRRIRTTDFICDKIKAICQPMPIDMTEE